MGIPSVLETGIDGGQSIVLTGMLCEFCLAYQIKMVGRRILFGMINKIEEICGLLLISDIAFVVDVLTAKDMDFLSDRKFSPQILLCASFLPRILRNFCGEEECK